MTAISSSAAERFPVMHSEPITVRILGGKDGRPLGRLHLVLIGGYDQRDMREELFREEVLTDARGQARLSNQLANLPWLQVWVGSKTLCQSHPRITGFSVDLIRSDGLSTPNLCGKATVPDTPGVFTVFVKGKGAVPAVPANASGSSQTVAPLSVSAAITSAATAAVRSGIDSCSSACLKRARRGRRARVRLVILSPCLAVALR